MDADECEEWPEATEATPKRVIRMRGTLRRNLSTPESREFWRAVTAASKAVAEWPEWKRLCADDDDEDDDDAEQMRRRG